MKKGRNLLLFWALFLLIMFFGFLIVIDLLNPINKAKNELKFIDEQIEEITVKLNEINTKKNVLDEKEKILRKRLELLKQQKVVLKTKLEYLIENSIWAKLSITE